MDTIWDMNYGILFASLSLVFAGINDVVFKRYALKDRSRGMYISGIGVIWTVLQTVRFTATGSAIHWDTTSLGFGLAAGLFLTLSNILLLESFTHIHVSLGSTIYRLNTIGVIILSFLCLHEPVGFLKLAGMLWGIIGIALLYQRNTSTRHHSTSLLFFGIAVMASCLRASYGVISKAGIVRQADPQTMLVVIALSWIVGGAWYAIVREKRFRITRKKVLYSLLSGILVFLIVNFLMLAIKYGQASIVIPIANMSFVVALFLSVIIKMETFSLRKSLAIICGVVSVILLSQA